MSKSYDLEFKINAIKRAREAKLQGVLISQTSRHLGVSKSMLHKWLKASEQDVVLANAFPGKGHLPVAEEEIRPRIARLMRQSGTSRCFFSECPLKACKISIS